MIDEKSMWRFAGVAPMAGPAEARHTHLQRNRAASPGQRIKWKRIDGRMHSMMFHDVPCISCMLHFKLPRCPRLPRSKGLVSECQTRFRQRAHASYRRSSCQLAKALTTSGRSAATSGRTCLGTSFVNALQSGRK